MSERIRRHHAVKTVTVALNGTTGDIRLDEFAGGLIILPAAWTGTTLAWHVSYDGTTFVPLYGESGATAATATAGTSRAIPIPTSAFGAKYVRFVVDAQAAARTVYACLSG